ncbi:hypothetical protein LEP1GSC163_4020 [Leptospira santarosai str. CBC379]|uniref:Uncharacterized protein n=1 Tax=Leptospira santarosai str. MOR084 TaxID=1049984 RepID=A0A0E2BQH8_9LEPT|nr:hypothetical protein LEP1GSC179_3226 [Leptospira santarosai str. MOR084]EKR93699.1 hypothetical protein LEP1GSC163_4020 [Leptospira santarosai str. CBC379]
MNILSVFILGKRFEFLIRSEAVCRRDRSKNTAVQHVSIRLENFLLVCGWKWKSPGSNVDLPDRMWELRQNFYPASFVVSEM